MKLNKTLALAALVAGSLFAGTTLQAQDSTNTPPDARPPKGHGMHAPNLDSLGLSDDVKAKVKTILDEQKTKMTELRKDTSLSQEDKKAKAKEIRDDTTAKLKEVLTAEQLEKIQKQTQRNRPGGHGGEATPATPPQQ